VAADARTVEVPLIVPVEGLTKRPVGSAGETVKDVAAPEGMDVTVNEDIELPFVKTTDDAPHAIAIWLTVTVRVTVADPPVLVAVITNGAELYKALGVPLNIPVTVFKLIPDGKVPLVIEYETTGPPVEDGDSEDINTPLWNTNEDAPYDRLDGSISLTVSWIVVWAEPPPVLVPVIV
jgi:hypothetical protein